MIQIKTKNMMNQAEEIALQAEHMFCMQENPPYFMVLKVSQTEPGEFLSTTKCDEEKEEKQKDHRT